MASNVYQWVRFVRDYMEELVRPMNPEDGVCRQNREERLWVDQRLLMAFGRCTHVPVFRFDMHRHTIRHWVRLYASAIRCSIHPCGRGFVVFKWLFRRKPSGESLM